MPIRKAARATRWRDDIGVTLKTLSHEQDRRCRSVAFF
jgi:hypothetical protein